MDKNLYCHSYGFPVAIYRYKSWSTKKAKCQIIDAFKLWSWRRLLRVSWTSKRSNKSVLKEISPEYSLEGQMLKLKLKLQSFSYLMQRANSLEKTLTLGKIECKRRRGQQKMRWLDTIIDLIDMNLSKLWRQWKTGKPGVLQSMGSKRVRHDLWTDWQQFHEKL